MTQHPPALVGISHGTSSEEGRRSVRGLHDAVAAAMAQRHPDATPPVRLGHVDVEQPDVPATLASLEPGEPAVVVPLLLSAGYHVHVDLTEAVEAETDRPVVLAGALGPDDRLAAVLLRRLTRRACATTTGSCSPSRDRAIDARSRTAATWPPGSPRHPPATCRWGSSRRPSRACPTRSPSARSDAAADGGRVVVANYLLAPGFFDDLARAAGADVTARPLLVPDEPAPRELVEIVLDRYDAASAALG